MAALGAQTNKNTPQDGPNKRHFGPQDAQNTTGSQSSSKRKIYYHSPDSLLYLILNKAYVRCFCVLTSSKSGLRFDVNLEMDKKGSWRHQEAENVPTETFWDAFGPQVGIKRAQHRPHIGPKRKNERHHWRNRFCSLRASLAGAAGRLCRLLVDVGSMFGSMLCHIRSMLSRSVCLSLSGIQPPRDHCQIARPGGMCEAIK